MSVVAFADATAAKKSSLDVVRTVIGLCFLYTMLSLSHDKESAKTH